MTDLTDLMRRATDDLDVPVTELVDRGIRHGRRRQRRRTGGQVLAVTCAVLAVATGGLLAGLRQQGNGPSVAGGTPEQLLAMLKEEMPAGGRIYNEHSEDRRPYWFVAAILYDGGGHSASVSVVVTRGPAGAPVCPPAAATLTCEIRPDGSALLRHATKAGPGIRRWTLADASVEVRRSDGISVMMAAGVLDGSRGHLFSLDQLTRMVDGRTWPEPAAAAPGRDASGRAMTADGAVIDGQILIRNLSPTPTQR